MSIIDPAEVSHRYEIEGGVILLLKEAKRCSSCELPMLLWVDAGEASTCLGCVGRAAQKQPTAEPRSTT